MAPDKEPNIYRAFSLGAVIRIHRATYVELIKHLDKKSKKPGFERRQETRTRQTLVSSICFLYPSTLAVEFNKGCFIRRDGRLITSPFINDSQGRPHKLTPDEIVPHTLIEQAITVFDELSPIKIRKD